MKKTIETDINNANTDRNSGFCEYDDLRPKNLDNFIGQEDIKKNLKVYINAAKQRGVTLDHVLFYGSPGLGKTTLAEIIANEMGGGFTSISATTITKTGELAGVLSRLRENDVLFIDEIHRLPKFIEEFLYTAMEDFFIDVIIGSNEQTKSIKLNLPHFTLVGATTRAGTLSEPLRDRFGITFKLEYYSDNELQEVIKAYSEKLNDKITEEAAKAIAAASRGTPRIALKNYKRIRDFAVNKEIIEETDVASAFYSMKINEKGICQQDYSMMNLMHNLFHDGPVGLKTLAATLGENPETIEDIYEPFLLRNGYIIKTNKGRCLTDEGIRLVNSI